MHRLWISLFAMSLSVATLPALAAELDEPVTDRVSFQVEVGSEVENDRLVAVLSASAEDKAPANLADTINRAMKWAMEQTQGSKSISRRTGSYQTYPVYDDRKIVNWRGKQELYLESQDVAEMSRLIGILQGRLQMQSLQFSVSPERKSGAEELLIEQALAAYQKRAEIISKSLGARGYRLIDVSINTGGHYPVVPLRAEVAMASRAKVSEPALESGTSRITVQASGAIQLLRD